jgi:hypothetical protein
MSGDKALFDVSSINATPFILNITICSVSERTEPVIYLSFIITGKFCNCLILNNILIFIIAKVIPESAYSITQLIDRVTSFTYFNKGLKVFIF